MKKILSLALAGVMMFSALPVAYAAEAGGNWAGGTAVEYTADEDANRNYTITVPAALEPGQSGTVTLKGMWASNETVTVTADASVELTNSINAADKHTLAITFPKMEYAGNNTVEKTYTETVAVAEMPENAIFGTWSGKFNYNVEFDDGIVDTVMFYDVKYIATDNSSAIVFHEDGTWDSYTDVNGNDPVIEGWDYECNGQNIISGVHDGSYFSADGYTFFQVEGSETTEFIYTP